MIQRSVNMPLRDIESGAEHANILLLSAVSVASAAAGAKGSVAHMPQEKAAYARARLYASAPARRSAKDAITLRRVQPPAFRATRLRATLQCRAFTNHTRQRHAGLLTPRRCSPPLCRACAQPPRQTDQRLS
jgi:hypothetical protein